METKVLPQETQQHKQVSHLSAMPGMKAPWFEGKCFYNNKFHHINLEDYKGYWLVLFFYPEDFDYMSPTDLIGLNDQYVVLRQKNCKIIGISTSSCMIHELFASTSSLNGGVKGLRFPLLEDVNSEISKAFSVLKFRDVFGEMHYDGHSFRAYFIVDPNGTIKARVVYDLPIGLGVKELVRQLVVLQKEADTGKLIGCYGESLGSEDKLKTDTDIEVKIEPGFEVFSPWYMKNILYNMGSGKFESPVDIQTQNVKEDPDLPKIGIDYPTELQPAELRNTGYGWQIDISPLVETMFIYGGPLGSSVYRLGHYKAHWGSSEHSVNGKKYDGELHFVHYNTKYFNVEDAIKHVDGIAIMAVFLKVTDDISTCLDEKGCEQLWCITEYIDSLKNMDDVVTINNNTDGFRPSYPDRMIPENSRDYWTYKGSTTEKEMTENVTWIIFKESMKINDDLLDAMKKFRFPNGTQILANYKPVQDLNGRVVFQPNRDLLN